MPPIHGLQTSAYKIYDFQLPPLKLEQATPICKESGRVPIYVEKSLDHNCFSASQRQSRYGW